MFSKFFSPRTPADKFASEFGEFGADILKIYNEVDPLDIGYVMDDEYIHEARLFLLHLTTCRGLYQSVRNSLGSDVDYVKDFGKIADIAWSISEAIDLAVQNTHN